LVSTKWLIDLQRNTVGALGHHERVGIGRIKILRQTVGGDVE
jgi:hypothetical protein